ncbi:hypothetical protein AUI51_03130 [archaeon 13_1_40CM_2_52_4]|nr:MAG: hypothetical protein AUI51_03130 [archaeon 13_1_40CM_2_52_4]
MSEQNLVRSEEVIGKTVVNVKAEKIGQVKDIAFDTSGRKALIVSSSQGVDKIYPFDQAVAIKDVVLLDESKTSATSLEAPVPQISQVPDRSMPTSLNQPPPIPRFAPQPGQASSIRTKICPSCKRENRLQSKFCVQCGKPL